MCNFIDVQYFIVSGELIVKELAIPRSQSLAHNVFKPPYKFSLLNEKDKKNIRWVEKYHLNLPWCEGTTPYADLNKILKKPKGSFVTKGKEETVWLNEHGVRTKEIEMKRFQIKYLRSSDTCLEDHQQTKFARA